MPSTYVLVPIIILLGASTIISIVVSLFKIRILPTFVIEIVVGIILGVFLNAYFDAQEGFRRMADVLYIIGFSLIMFLSGYDINLEMIKDKEPSSAKHINVGRISVFILLAVYVIAGLFALIFFRYYEKAVLGMILVTLTLASTFAGVVAPLVHVEKLGRTGWGSTMITFSFLSELTSIILLTIFMIINKVSIQYTSSYLIMIGLFALFFIATKIRRGRRLEEGMVYLTTKMIIIVLASSVFLSDLGGGEYVLGAFIFGLFLKLIKFPEEKMHQFEGFSYGVFIPMFFILVGMKIDIVAFASHIENIGLVFLIFAGFLLAKMPLLYLLRWYQIRTVTIAIVLSSCTLVVAIAAEHIGVHLHIFDHIFGQALILASVLTSIVAPIVYEVGCFRSLRHVRMEEKELTYGVCAIDKTYDKPK